MPRGVYERKDAPKVTAERAADSKIGDETNHRTVPVPVDARITPAGISYLALKPMKVNGEKVNPGDLVEGAAEWRNVHNYVSAGYLAPIQTPEA